MKAICCVCGVPAPHNNPQRAGWIVRGYSRLVCPECRAENRLLNEKARSGRSGAFKKNLRFNDTIADFTCQEPGDAAFYAAAVEDALAQGAKRVRFV